MVELKWYAVRCCCAPVKVMGFVKAEADQYRTRQFVPLRDKRGNQHEVELRDYRHPAKFESLYPIKPEDNIDVALFVNRVEVAVYSDDRPLSFWTSLVDFIPNPEYKE